MKLFSKNIGALLLAALTLAVCPTIAVADQCPFPNPSVYSAPLAKVYIGYIQSSFPDLQFDPTVSRVFMSLGPYDQSNVMHIVSLRTVDGTVLDVIGTLVVAPVDEIDNEGNIIGCSLRLKDFGEYGFTLDSVVNDKSGHTLPFRQVELRNGDLGIHYPYSPGGEQK